MVDRYVQPSFFTPMESSRETQQVWQNIYSMFTPSAESHSRKEELQSQMRTILSLPPSGVYNEEGILFHQVHLGHESLKEKHLQRLKEHGIPLETRVFNSDEDDILRKNWTEFASDHGIPFEDANLYVCQQRTKYMKHLSFKDTRFWPRMCRDLPQRSAMQVSSRFHRIFDRAVLSGSDAVTYKVRNAILGAERELLFKLYKEFRDWDTVAKKLGRTRVKCVETHYLHLKNQLAKKRNEDEGENSLRVERRRLWDHVVARTVLTESTKDEKPPETFRQVIKRAVRTNTLEVVQGSRASIPFLSISIDLTSVKSWCENDWKVILETLQSAFNRLVEEGLNEEDAWLACFREVLGDVGHITLTAYCKFLRHLADATPPNILLGCLRSKYYNLDKLSEQLKLDDVCEFFCDNMSEVEYLISKTQTILSRSQMLLFNRLKRRYSLKDRLLVLSSAFSRQLQQHGQPLPQVDIEVFNGRIQEQATNSPNVFPSLESEALVEALILHTISLQNDWQPPAKLKKYVKSEDVLSLFPAQKNNGEWLKESDIVKPYLCESDSEEEVEVSEHTVEKLASIENQCDDRSAKRVHKKKKKRNKESSEEVSIPESVPPKKKKRKKDKHND